MNITKRNTAFRFTDQEMEIAKTTDLLEHLGYHVKQVGQFYTTREMDSLRIKNRRTWRRYSSQQGGDAITFLQEFCGKGFREAVEYLLEFNGGCARDSPSLPEPCSPPQPEERPEFVLPPANGDNRRVFAYLRKRGIAPQVIRAFLDSGLLYVGWGGIPDAFDPDKPEWSAEYAELKDLLTDEKYSSARASTLNAHFTPPVVIKAIYAAIERLGFKSGNILEPSCGVGNFFGCLPESMAVSRLYGVELDGISGRIAKQLYPKANITVAGFETTSQRDFFDLAVGNVPFGDYKVHDPAYDKYGFRIHNYFLAKTLDQLRPGGVMAFVTSRYTMDSKDSTARRWS